MPSQKSSGCSNLVATFGVGEGRGVVNPGGRQGYLEEFLLVLHRCQRWPSNGEAKFWLQPEIRLAKNYHYSRKQLRDIAAIIEEHEVELIRAWQKHFGS
jgi:hypothetical protein